jgi:hypothetical protein
MTEEEKSFVIKDRRRFTSEEQKDQKAAAEPETKSEKEKSSGLKTEAKKQDERKKAEDKTSGKKETGADTAGSTKTHHLPKINFSTFMLSLNSSALVQLGLIEDPATGKKEKNLPLAKQTIDIIGMLEEKTKGNLSEDENRMIKTFLYDLRMMYVREAG